MTNLTHLFKAGQKVRSNKMKQNYNVILEKGDYALIERGVLNPEYAVVYGLVPENERKYKGSDWSGTVSYTRHNVEGLAATLDLFRSRTEIDYITRQRLEELVTKFKDGLFGTDLEDEEYEEFFTDECKMEDYEKEFFGIKEKE